jgi:hypothetical protein
MVVKIDVDSIGKIGYTQWKAPDGRGWVPMGNLG